MTTKGSMMRIHPLACGLGFAFLIEAPQGSFLVDSGSPGQQERVLAKMKALGRADLKLIWVTHAHYDHYGSALALRELTGARIGVHPLDAHSLSTGHSPHGIPHHYGVIFALVQTMVNRIWPLQATSPDFLLEDGETLEGFGLNASVLHTPGHTCLLLPDGIAFASDLIASIPSSRLQFLVATDWSQLPNRLRRFQAGQPKWTYPGHSRHPIPGRMIQKINRRT
jgi:hydroxyacylglutathione hydrolase